MPLLGLIGYPLGHSFSPSYFKNKFEQLGLEDWDYQLFPIPSLIHLPEVIEEHPDLLAFNITIPHKTAILPFCHSYSEAVEVIGAANLVLIDRQHSEIRLHAHNTDVIGFRKSLEQVLDNTDKHAVVFGTGGASKAAVFVLNELHIPHIVIGRQTNPNYQDIDLSQYNLFINCTPIGMYKITANSEIDTLPLIYDSIRQGSIYFDMVYNPEKTSMMTLMESKGARVKNGLDMLHFQADAAWEIIQNNLLDNMDNSM